MNINDNEFVKFLENYIDRKINEKLKNLQSMRALPAKIVLVNGDGTVNVQIAGDSVNTLTNIKNKSGVVLSVNDCVYLYLPTGVLTGCYVGVKF